MEQAVANLGKFLTVRQDGKGDFKTHLRKRSTARRTELP